jgi:hypothetical protein
MEDVKTLSPALSGSSAANQATEPFYLEGLTIGDFIVIGAGCDSTIQRIRLHPSTPMAGQFEGFTALLVGYATSDRLYLGKIIGSNEIQNGAAIITKLT